MARDASIPMIEVADAILWSNILRGCYVGRGRHVSRGSRVENKEESFMNKLIAIGLFAGAACGALAQSAAPAQNFPDGAVVPTAAEIRGRLAGKIFTVKLADGGNCRWEYRDDGYFFFNSGGFKDSGKWRTEEGKLCHNGRKVGDSCNSVVEHSNTLHMKRDSGEIVKFEPQ